MDKTDVILPIVSGIKSYGFFGVFLVLLAVEQMRPFRVAHVSNRRRWLINLQLTLLNIFVHVLIPVTLISVAVLAQKHGAGLLNQVHLPLFALIFVNILARAFISYVAHYSTHKVPFLWRFHRVHHLDTAIDVTTTSRFHPFEIGWILFVGAPIVFILGLDPLMLALYDVFKAPINVFAHANVKLPAVVDRLSKYLIVTPYLHRSHHSSLRCETDSNYSDLFPIWDLICGTFRAVPIERQAIMEVGLGAAEDPRHMNLSWLLSSFWRGELTDSTPDRDPREATLTTHLQAERTFPK